jgi:hypothetical protein
MQDSSKTTRRPNARVGGLSEGSKSGFWVTQILQSLPRGASEDDPAVLFAGFENPLDPNQIGQMTDIKFAYLGTTL